MLVDRGGPDRAKCDCCQGRTHKGLELHELINRGRTVGDDRLRELTFVPELCALLCEFCHDEAHTPEVRWQLFQLAYLRYGVQPVRDAFNRVAARAAELGVPLDIELPLPRAPSRTVLHPRSHPYPYLSNGRSISMTTSIHILKILAANKIPVAVGYEPTRFISTGSLYLDWCFGGGLPVGRITDIWGREGSGKTTLSLLMAKHRVLQGEYVAYVDVENALDPAWAARFGLSFDGAQRFYLIQPDSAEVALNAVRKLLNMKHPDDKERSLFSLIVLDSIAALTTEAELKGEIGDRTVAGRAQVIAAFLNKTRTELRESDTALLFINQERDKFGMSFGYGEPVQQPGGRSVRFYSSIIGKMKGSPVEIKEHGEVVGNEFAIRTTKNKVAPPKREAAIKVYFDTGTVGIFDELAAVGFEMGVFCNEDGATKTDKRGTWYFLRDDGPAKLATGEKNVADFLDANRDIAAEVETAVRAAIQAQSSSPFVCMPEDSGDESPEPFWDDDLAGDDLA